MMINDEEEEGVRGLRRYLDLQRWLCRIHRSRYLPSQDIAYCILDPSLSPVS